jgi:hypothetical protein
MAHLLSETKDRKRNTICVGDFAKLETFDGNKVVGIVTIISENKIGVETPNMHYSRNHNLVEKVSEDEYMIYKLES